jgi:hypothetical protein
VLVKRSLQPPDNRFVAVHSVATIQRRKRKKFAHPKFLLSFFPAHKQFPSLPRLWQGSGAKSETYSEAAHASLSRSNRMGSSVPGAPATFGK